MCATPRARSSPGSAASPVAAGGRGPVASDAPHAGARAPPSSSPPRVYPASPVDAVARRRRNNTRRIPRPATTRRSRSPTPPPRPPPKPPRKSDPRSPPRRKPPRAPPQPPRNPLPDGGGPGVARGAGEVEGGVLGATGDDGARGAEYEREPRLPLEPPLPTRPSAGSMTGSKVRRATRTVRATVLRFMREAPS